MKGKIFLVLSLIFFMSSLQKAYGQKMRHNKRQQDVLLCPIKYKRKLFTHSLGARIGEPWGLSYKLSFKQKIAAEIVAGVGFSGLFDPYLENQFYQQDFVKELNSPKYLDHSGNIYALLTRIMYQGRISKDYTADWYAGIGFSFRRFETKYLYDYQTPEGQTSEPSSRNTEVTFRSPDIFAGFEYSHPKTPVSAFAEVGLFVNFGGADAAPDFQGGMGIRYTL
ncbi:hypothetical protein OO013_11620 [Mangrovivirga sp. M17]|uniref:Outer membrane protein with beta-barrel domain n=1 Tax=Mangrovivirga halotolerans TaxID=2993936 RepID=A0ABT3RT42_9BACT|nr:hypothetical protein [Mangrovivirga halotolerans]MCX2744519.1 hypothetical protein [Mangrovivirga halotolerans]